MGTTFIYALIDPRTQQVYYVGKSNNPSKRLRNHIFNVKFYKPNPFLTWVEELLNEELRPFLRILEETPIDKWEERERHYISLFKDLGHPLKNLTEGGNVFGREAIQRAAKSKKKPILQYSLDGGFIREWPSIREAAMETKVPKSSIYSSLNIPQHTAGGYIWRFKIKDEPIVFKIEKEKRKKTYKPIIQVFEDGTEKEWPSIKEAAECLNISRLTIYNSIKKQETTKGVLFKKNLSDPIWNHVRGKLNKVFKNYQMVLPEKIIQHPIINF